MPTVYTLIFRASVSLMERVSAPRPRAKSRPGSKTRHRASDGATMGHSLRARDSRAPSRADSRPAKSCSARTIRCIEPCAADAAYARSTASRASSAATSVRRRSVRSGRPCSSHSSPQPARAAARGRGRAGNHRGRAPCAASFAPRAQPARVGANYLAHLETSLMRRARAACQQLRRRSYQTIESCGAPRVLQSLGTCRASRPDCQRGCGPANASRHSHRRSRYTATSSSVAAVCRRRPRAGFSATLTAATLAIGAWRSRPRDRRRGAEQLARHLNRAAPQSCGRSSNSSVTA